ncbi:hypothetical protein [Prochlorococcus marinus]|uniref:Uncharacterized protein n=1 Tax=Prochlorococcus marinus (strain MIT 9303) TaxID=59922 RepID=A2C920_PROM3|nr:hypothetical protein [Prochlorococcus marinus]ABM77980.1 Hypothetical protein P9303_12311 [Prochlorococcus marinus str. MIT 9303]
MAILKTFMIRLKRTAILLALPILVWITFSSTTVFAAELVDVEEPTPLELKVAKGYSGKFCNGIAMGLTQQSALKIAIAENRKPSFNPSLWTAVISNDKQLESIDENKIASLVALTVVNDCGDPLGLNSQTDVDEFASYFMSMREDSLSNQ